MEISDSFQKKIQKIILKSKASVSVLIYDYREGRTVASVIPDRKIVSASMIKTPIMLAALDRVKNGFWKLEEPILVPSGEILPDSLVFDRGEESIPLEELLTWMIIDSDNTAANVLIRLLGADSINQYCASLGLKQTLLQRKMLDWDAVREGRENYTSAADQLKLFSALRNRSILTPGLCSLSLGILEHQRDFSKALRYLCSREIVFAHKTGSLDFLRHDAGIFHLPQRDYFFGCFVWDARENSRENPVASRLIGRISQAAFRFLIG